MQRLKATGAPVDSVDAMIGWFAALPASRQTKLSPTFRHRLIALRMERDRPTAPPATAAALQAGTPTASASPAVPGDPYWAQFEADRAARGATSPASHHDSLTRTRLLRDFAQFKLERAQAANDLAAASDAAALFKLNSDILHDEELRAARLNRETGEALPRSVAEAFLRALAYWLARLNDHTLTEATRAFTAATARGAPLYREEIHAILEPLLLSRRLFEPLRRASGTTAPLALPPWAIASLHAALEATLENPTAQSDPSDNSGATPPLTPAPPTAAS